MTAGKNSVEKRFVAVDPDSVQPFERLIANQRIGLAKLKVAKIASEIIV